MTWYVGGGSAYVARGGNDVSTVDGGDGFGSSGGDCSLEWLPCVCLVVSGMVVCLFG